MSGRSLNLRFRIAALGVAVSMLAGCASPNIEQAVQEANQTTIAFAQGKLELSRTEQQAGARQRLAEQLLAEPLSMSGAVQLALANSPAVQTLLAQSWSDLAAATQAGNITNPVLAFERMRFKDELELGRLLSFGILDLLTLPQRQAISRNQAAQAKVQLSVNVVDQVSQVRQAWVRAVAARQLLDYAKQVSAAAQASAELARRMQQVGNFTKLQRARQHVFYADAVAQLALAQHAATAAREDLTRQLGLTDVQASRLILPARLADLPGEPRSASEVSSLASGQRLDIQQARLQLDAAGSSQRLNLLTSLVDVELGLRRDTVFDNSTGERGNRKGYELGIRLPVFDWGEARRASMNAQSLAAANRYDGVVRAASSHLRESYSAYRTAYDLARHYRDEIVPLRKTMSEENVLRYNGMLIGVFELLADTREQIASVMAAIDAQQQFWLADAALSSSLIGKPLPIRAVATAPGASGGAEGQGH